MERNHKGLHGVAKMNCTQTAEEFKTVAKSLYVYMVAGKTYDPYVFHLINESRAILTRLEDDLKSQIMAGRSDLKGLAAYER